MDTVEILRRLEQAAKYRKLFTYLPYGLPETLYGPDNPHVKSWSNKPWQLNFNNAGLDNQERMLMAANRVGKTQTAAPEVAFHMTGLYPEWWKGKRFNSPVLVWTGSPTNETSRDIIQKSLLGGSDKERLGTGWIPRDLIVGRPKMRQAGVSDVVDTFDVRHVSGGISSCVMKTYEQGWRKWQGTEPHVVWLDEEPDANSSDQKPIYTEALTRILTSHGIMMVTFTPLLGLTDLVIHYRSAGKGVFMETATWEDAPHLDKEERERLKLSYPDHEVQARTQGVPMMGEGRIFTAPEDDIVIPPFELPRHYARLCGIDFGIDHPAAGAWLAWDRDRDVLFLYDSYKKEKEDAIYHAAQIKAKGNWIPVSWPHDGTQKEKGSGKRLCDIYKGHGVRMLSRSARYVNDVGGSQPQWPVIEEIIERMKTNRFKVFSDQYKWLEEYRNYHTKDGKIVSVRDDILKATFYAVMMKRYAVTESMHSSTNNIPRGMTMRL